MLKTVLLFFVVVLFIAPGCRRSDVNTFHVSGTVSYKGEPLKSGRVLFLPDTIRGNDGPSANAEVVNGRFNTKGELRPGGGAYRVVVMGSDPAKPDAGPVFEWIKEIDISGKTTLDLIVPDDAPAPSES